MILIIITLGIIGLEAYALHLGYNGKMLLTVIGILSTVAGWQGKKKQVTKRIKKFNKAIEDFETGKNTELLKIIKKQCQKN